MTELGVGFRLAQMPTEGENGWAAAEAGAEQRAKP